MSKRYYMGRAFPGNSKKNVKNAKKSVLEYINKNLKNILPIELDYIEFQIRIKAKEYEKLSDKYKKELLKYQIPKGDDEDGYWPYCDSFIFDFQSKKSLCLSINCIYGYEGLEKSTDIFFIQDDEFTEFIRRNIGLNERDEIWMSG